MAASDAQWLLQALSDVVEGLEDFRTSGRTITRPNVGTLHYMPMPAGQVSFWGVVKRYPDEVEPFYAIFEVEKDEEPSLLQVAHYVAVRRLEAHYLGHGAATGVLGGLLARLPDSVGRPEQPLLVADFRAVSLRIPRNPFEGDIWKIRYRHREIAECIFELEYAFADISDASVYVDPVAAAPPLLH